MEEPPTPKCAQDAYLNLGHGPAKPCCGAPALALLRVGGGADGAPCTSPHAPHTPKSDKHAPCKRCAMVMLEVIELRRQLETCHTAHRALLAEKVRSEAALKAALETTQQQPDRWREAAAQVAEAKRKELEAITANEQMTHTIAQLKLRVEAAEAEQAKAEAAGAEAVRNHRHHLKCGARAQAREFAREHAQLEEEVRTLRRRLEAANAAAGIAEERAVRADGGGVAKLEELRVARMKQMRQMEAEALRREAKAGNGPQDAGADAMHVVPRQAAVTNSMAEKRVQKAEIACKLAEMAQSKAESRVTELAAWLTEAGERNKEAVEALERRLGEAQRQVAALLQERQRGAEERGGEGAVC